MHIQHCASYFTRITTELVVSAAAIGSGGSYALAAARALIDIPDLTAEAVAKKAMTIAADTCIYTNHNFTTETLESKKEIED